MEKRNNIKKKLQDENLSPFMDWKGTPGVGDFMYGLNIAHWKSFILNREIFLRFHWYHAEDFLYHYEDPETIIERLNYIHSFYSNEYSKIRIKHTFNSNSGWIYSNRFRGYNRNIRKSWKFRVNDWILREDLMNYPTIENKIVLWRNTTNAEDPRPFKMPFTHDEWNQVIDIIELQGYKVFEINYRTPISEVLYHIKTCICTVSYEGMWHYIAKNLRKPMIVLSSDPITNMHTPDALIYNPRKNAWFDAAKGDKPKYSLSYFYDFEKRIKLAKEYSTKRIGYLDEILNEYRQSSN
jgi:hypothetical protein